MPITYKCKIKQEWLYSQLNIRFFNDHKIYQRKKIFILPGLKDFGALVKDEGCFAGELLEESGRPKLPKIEIVVNSFEKKSKLLQLFKGWVIKNKRHYFKPVFLNLLGDQVPVDHKIFILLYRSQFFCPSNKCF